MCMSKRVDGRRGFHKLSMRKIVSLCWESIFILIGREVVDGIIVRTGEKLCMEFIEMLVAEKLGEKYGYGCLIMNEIVGRKY